MALIEILDGKCRKCYACVRICPVQAIKVDVKRDIPEILENRCIGCGSCVTACNPEAIVYQNSMDEVKSLLNSGQKVAAVVALSISGEFSDISDYRKFVEMIRRLGFTYVHEVSFGVDLVAQKYADLFENNRGKNYVTSTCPAVFYYIEKFHPELLENLAPIVSPMIASAKVVHKKYGEEVKVVYIGPCIATKTEALRYNGTDGHVDAVITFHELRKLFSEFNIKESMLEFSDFDAPLGYKGSLYPISNGLLQAADISEDLLHGNVVTTEGRNNMIEAVREIEQRPENINRHFNIFYDEGGCLMGPGTTKNGKRFLRRTLVISYTRKRLRNFSKREWAKNMKIYSFLDLTASFICDDQRIPTPSEEKLNEVLKALGRQEASENLSCGSCGYESCQEFALSVAKGLTKTDMCFNFSMRNRQEHIQNLKLINDKLAKTQHALQNSEKIARHEQQLAKEAMQTIETMLQKLPTAIVIVDEHLRVIQANETLIRMLGPEAGEINEVIPGLVGADIKTLVPFQVHNLLSYVMANGEDIQNRDIHLNDQLYNLSVFTIRKNKVVGAIMRDMQSPEIRKEEVVKRIGDVIDKNLEMVQKIGFLLGEGAAETEKMLNSIMEFYKSEKK
jgi:Na+-translocating ferredoxin:NAD+ oxidoreductase RNF subunit RnfB